MEGRAAPSFPVVVIGGSAGSLDALRRIIAGLPSDFPAAIYVATHVPPTSASALPHILTRSGSLFATHALDGAPIAPGQIVVAPPDHHVLLEDGHMRAFRGPRENNHRPSIDVLFRSAAMTFGPSACGVLLSGTLDDGVAGLVAIHAAGGKTLVQDPADAEFPDLPENALKTEAVDGSYPAAEMAAAITAWLEQPRDGGRWAHFVDDARKNGMPSVFTCPDCGGTLWEADDDSVLRFRCRVGHAYNGHSMLASHQTKLEEALWAALRALEERRDLLKRLSARSEETGDRITARRLRGKSEETEANLKRIYAGLEAFLSAASQS